MWVGRAERGRTRDGYSKREITFDWLKKKNSVYIHTGFTVCTTDFFFTRCRSSFLFSIFCFSSKAQSNRVFIPYRNIKQFHTRYKLTYTLGTWQSFLVVAKLHLARPSLLAVCFLLFFFLFIRDSFFHYIIRILTVHVGLILVLEESFVASVALVCVCIALAS